jgi:hypothetical protein
VNGGNQPVAVLKPHTDEVANWSAETVAAFEGLTPLELACAH